MNYRYNKGCEIVGTFQHCLNSMLHFVVYRYRVAYNKETGECKLEISMTFADDAGEYTIIAKNQLGEVSASAQLYSEG